MRSREITKVRKEQNRQPAEAMNSEQKEKTHTRREEGQEGSQCLRWLFLRSGITDGFRFLYTFRHLQNFDVNAC